LDLFLFQEDCMAKVAIVTDSTANLPAEVTRTLPIYSVPLHVIWEEKSYLDQVEMSADEFYARLRTDKVLPTTSQPPPSAFKEVYVHLLEEGYDILTITIASKLSGTMDSAIQARATLPGPRIELVDSDTTSLALGFQVLAAARIAEQGATLKECKTIAEQAKQKTGVLFVLKTLEFLARGGRIGGAAAFVGTLLNLKPILEIREGRVEAVERVRTSAKALDRVLDIFEQRAHLDSAPPLRIAVLHSDTADEAEELLVRARQRFGLTEVSEAFIGRVSPVIGVHAGPGALGIAYMTGM
jgi:DegV family protein with EDD domain